MMKGREKRDNKCPPPLHTENYNGSRFLLDLFAVPTGHHQQKYPETEEDCVTDRDRHNHGIESRLIRSCISHSAQPTDQPTESTLQGVQELMKKEKEKERKKRKSELLLLLPTQTEQNRETAVRLWAAMNHALSGIGWSPIGFV